ncbi:hypothetical protein EDC01DRAFT_377226 [Geopyxis carbonaria]|nr:hypothetical protein EDC01DRAFT_377226 [Geopyxis carbonaria]
MRMRAPAKRASPSRATSRMRAEERRGELRTNVRIECSGMKKLQARYLLTARYSLARCARPFADAVAAPGRRLASQPCAVCPATAAAAEPHHAHRHSQTGTRLTYLLALTQERHSKTATTTTATTTAPMEQSLYRMLPLLKLRILQCTSFAFSPSCTCAVGRGRNMGMGCEVTS